VKVVPLKEVPMNAPGRALVLTATLLLSGCFGGARIISPFGDFRGPEGYPRSDGPHKGIDIAGMVGDPVLAVADGVIIISSENEGACGTMVVVRHSFGHDSIYCHLLDVTKTVGEEVRRGEVIGHLGTSGGRVGAGFEHVHLSVRNSNREHVDPERLTVGCFEPSKAYPTDRLVLTFPVHCKN
jgi:murein DD-endopeptidase MepM/ murein hydrolase activator NlpD